MTKNKILSFLIFFFTTAFPAFSQIPEGFTGLENPDQLKKQLIESAQQTQSLVSNFTQEKHLTMMEEVLVSKGRFLFKKENKVRWEYDSPINYTILISNNQFLIDNDGKISTFNTESNKMFKEINRMILMAIEGNFVNDTSFAADYYSGKNDYLAVLTPHDKMLRNILSKIEIFFNKSDISVDQVKFIEPENDYTLIIFSDKKKNINIEDAQFTLSEK